MEFSALHMLQNEEIEEEQDEQDRAMEIAAAIICVGAEEARLARARNRLPSRLYLCRAELCPNPHINTPWQYLYRSRSDRAFITTMGFDVETFEGILSAGFAQKYYETPIPRDDVASTGSSRPGRRSLDAAGALGLVLHFLNSTMREISLQQIFALIPTSVSRYNNFSLTILLDTIKSMPDAQIIYPRNAREFEECNYLITNRHPRLLGAFGGIDGLNLPVQTSEDEDIENATFNGWLAEHFISSVLAFSPKGPVIAAKLNAPGSWHDSRVAKPIYEKLRDKTPPGYYLVADTAFPRGSSQIEGRIKAPIKAGQRITGGSEEVAEKLAFNRELLSYRQTAEWGMRALQGSFGRLRVPLEINQTEKRACLLETCVRLHNLRANRVGINQIRSVYMKQWRETDELDDLWKNFENLLFSEQRARDRVSNYHVYASYDED